MFTDMFKGALFCLNLTLAPLSVRSDLKEEVVSALYRDVLYRKREQTERADEVMLNMSSDESAASVSSDSGLFPLPSPLSYPPSSSGKELSRACGYGVM